MMSISKALTRLVPGVEFVMTDEDLSTIQWFDKRPIPSLDDINTYIKSQEYVERRRAEYPPLGDQLDAIWKGGDAEAQMRDRIISIKSKYPKGQ